MGDDSAIRLKIYAQSLSCLCTIGVMVTFLPSKQKLTVRVCYGALGFISFTYRDKNGNAGKHVCYPGVITPISSPRRTDLRANIRLPIFEYNVGYLYTVNSTLYLCEKRRRKATRHIAAQTEVANPHARVPAIQNVIASDSVRIAGIFFI